MTDTPRRGPGRPRKEQADTDSREIKIGWRSVWTSQGVKTNETVTLPNDEADQYVNQGLADEL